MRDAGLEPLEPCPGSDKPWRCRHEACGREVTPRLGNIAAGRQGGCRYCSGTAPIPPEEAVALMRSAGLEPLELYPTATPPWRCRHVPCGREVKERYSYIRRGGGPCRWCAPNAPVDPDLAVALMRSAVPNHWSPIRHRHPLAVPPHNLRHDRNAHSWVGQGRTRDRGPCGRKNAGRGISRAWSRRRELCGLGKALTRPLHPPRPLTEARFTKGQCRPCPVCTRCTTSHQRARNLSFPPRELRDLHVRVRAEQQTPD